LFPTWKYEINADFYVIYTILETRVITFVWFFFGLNLHPPIANAGAPLVVAPVWVVQPDKAEVGHQPATDDFF
jgi:hypothetical protein